MAEPVYSKTWPVPPPTPIFAMSARMMSLAETPGCKLPFDADFKRLRFALQEALRGEDVFHFAGADAEGQRAERAVRGGVTVAADDGHAGLRDAQLRPDDVHDALMWAAQSVELHAELGAVLFEQFDLLAAHFVGKVEARELIAVERDGRDRMIDGADGLIGAADFQAARAQTGKGLRRGHFVDEVQIDVEDGG